VALVGASAAAFIDKFIRGFLGADLVKIARDDLGKEELSLSETLSKVAEPLSKALYEEYVEERKINDYTYDLIIAGFEDAERVDAFTLYGRGLAEPVDDFTAIGSGGGLRRALLKVLPPLREEA
jgi:hypothetical protein